MSGRNKLNCVLVADSFEGIPRMELLMEPGCLLVMMVATKSTQQHLFAHARQDIQPLLVQSAKYGRHIHGIKHFKHIFASLIDTLANPVFGKRHLVKVAPVEAQRYIRTLPLIRV